MSRKNALFIIATCIALLPIIVAAVMEMSKADDSQQSSLSPLLTLIFAPIGIVVSGVAFASDKDSRHRVFLVVYILWLVYLLSVAIFALALRGMQF